MKNIISHTYFNRTSKRYINSHWAVKHGVKKEQIDFKKSFVQKRVIINNNEIEYVKIPYLDFFDCDCPRNGSKNRHTEFNCEYFKIKQYEKLKSGKFNMNKRNSKMRYSKMVQRYKPNYAISFYIKDL
jgi:hypothetical protein